MRKRVGFLRHRASFLRHNGTLDSHGQPTYNTPSDWEVFFEDWPCEFVSTVGGEILRGRQVTAKSTHAMFGNYIAVEGIDAKMKVEKDGLTYGITSFSDPEGIRTEMRVELRLEK